MERKCETCEYWKPWKSGHCGNCYRYPPSWYSFGEEGDTNNGAGFPVAEKTDWCGEWKKGEDGGGV